MKNVVIELMEGNTHAYVEHIRVYSDRRCSPTIRTNDVRTARKFTKHGALTMIGRLHWNGAIRAREVV